MELISTTIPDVLLLRSRRFGDERGYFMECYNEETFRRVTGLSTRFVQDNEAYSRRDVVRGLHYQLAPHAQAKLVRVVSGRVLDVAVDIRKGSPTFGQYVAVELSAENGLQLYIPEGFAHGYAVLSDEAVFQYKCSDFYHPEAEAGIAFDDPQLAIAWPIPQDEMILSAKDRCHPSFAEAKLFE